MITLSKADVDSVLSDPKILSNIERGLKDYQWLQDNARKCDVRQSNAFQAKYSKFYVIWFRPIEWKKSYFALLQESKLTKPHLSFREVLDRLKIETGKVEASFASKLVATLEPEKQIIDKYVLQNFDLFLPALNSKNRIDETVKVYEQLGRQYEELIHSSIGKTMCRQFDEHFPNSGITSLKKIDFILWQMRPEDLR